jgi:hypothetical protein
LPTLHGLVCMYADPSTVHKRKHASVELIKKNDDVGPPHCENQYSHQSENLEADPRTVPLRHVI